jgi:micrococcal nuclease
MGFFGIFSGVKKIIFLILIAAGIYFFYKVSPSSFNFLKIKSETLTVTRVVDGDTFVLSNKERVRLIGIDTPEKFESKKMDADAARSGKDKAAIRELGKAASEYVKKLVEGKVVTIQSDNMGSDRDKYNRLLRYVYLENGVCVNAKIIQDGYANAYTKFPFEKMEEFKKLEREARINKRGLWNEGLE